MTEYKRLNVKISNSQLNKLKSATKKCYRSNSKTFHKYDWGF